MDEKLLIAGCKAGESWACKQLYETYAPPMMSVCMRYVNNRETARDLLQDGFIKVFTKIGDYRGSGSFGGWVRKVFVTTSLEYLRATDAIRWNLNLDETDSLSLAADDESALDKLSADELMDCLAQLPGGYRTVFNLYAIEGYSHKEIAGMLRINEITSRTQFIRARNTLQKNVLALMEYNHAEYNRI